MIFKNKILSEIVKLNKFNFFELFVFSFFVNLLFLTPSIYMLQVYDRVLTSYNLATLSALTIIVIFVYLVLSLVDKVRAEILLNISNQVENDLVNKVYIILHKYQEQKSSITQYVNDVMVVKNFIAGQSLVALLDFPWLFIYLFVLFVFNYWLGLAAVISCLILFLLTVVQEVFTKTAIHNANNMLMNANLMAQDTTRNSEIVSALSMRRTLNSLWRKSFDGYTSHSLKANQLALNLTSVSKFLKLIFQSLALGLSAWLVIENEIKPGMMIAGIILFSRAISPIDSINILWKQLATFKESSLRLSNIFEGNENSSNKLNLLKPEYSLGVENVFITPPQKKIPVIKNLSFLIPAGSITSVVGPVGSGKSSLLRVLIGLWELDKGVVRLDGFDVNDWNRDELGVHLGYLPQDVQLLRGTIAENISRFDECESSEIFDAAKLAGSHEMILKLPEGYGTVLGDSGAGLSGGQKQQIGLARALFRSPSIIVLDEPTSYFDEQSKQQFIGLLKKLKTLKKIVVVATHQKEIVNNSDYLIVLFDADKNIFGTKDEVFAKQMRR